MKESRRRVSTVIIHQGKLLGFNAEDPFNSKRYFFLPGGMIENGESIFETAYRETLEETGYKIEVIEQPVIKRNYDFEWNGKVFNCETTYVTGRVLHSTPEPVDDASYNKGTDWVAVNEIPQIFDYHSDILQPILELSGTHLKTANGIEYFCNRKVSPKEIASLYDDSGIRRPTSDIDRIAKMYKNSNLVISAWKNDLPVGIARTLTDFSYCSYLSDLAVKKEMQKMGVGKKLIDLTKSLISQQSMLLLLSSPDAMQYYPKVGFASVDNGFIIKRSD